MKKVAFHTLGCKVNQVETEQLKEEFIKRGYLITGFDEKADIYIINTCTVTHVSDRKSRAVIRRAARKNPGALVIATGCLAQIDAEQLAGIEGIDLVVGNGKKEKIAAIIDRINAGDMAGRGIIGGPIDTHDKLSPVLYSKQHQRTRAFVKIQDGCESFCSYCIVPYTRGPVRSKVPSDVVSEIRQLVMLGYREIVLTGIHSGFYGKDLDGWNLVKLLEYILNSVKGDYRIRLSSVEPLEVTDELVNLMVSDRKLCRHLHIPLQSGSNKVLKAMNRRYTREYYKELVMSIEKKISGVAFTADVMVGFPLEENDDFEDTYKLLEELPMFDLHVFKYSRRPGTKAAAYYPGVSEEEKHKRSNKLLQLAQNKREQFIRGCLGQEIRLLVEKKAGPDMYIGLSDNYVEVIFTSHEDMTGDFTAVKIENMDNNTVTGKLI